MFIDAARDQIVFQPTGELERTGKLDGMQGLGRVTIGVTGANGAHAVRAFTEVDGALVEVKQVGPDSRGPLCCLRCTRVFKPGEAWHRLTSDADPEVEAYSVGVHEICPQSVNIGVEYYEGKPKPYRAYVETAGVKKYVGYFKREADAWDAAKP